MRKTVFFAAVLIMLGFAAQSQASLTSVGTGTIAGDVSNTPYQLIYDSALNVTWLDYSRGYDTWQGQTNWASNLTVNFNGKQYKGWSLPAAPAGQAGYNDTNIADQMSYLYYVELGNTAPPQGNWGLVSTGPFKNLISSAYWAGTAYDASDAWYFYQSSGYEGYNSNGSSYLALAVLPGNVATPVPGAFLLFGSGLAGLIGWRFTAQASC